MGEIADYIVDRMIFGPILTSCHRKTFQSGSGDFKWKLASGEVINMYDMTRPPSQVPSCIVFPGIWRLRRRQSV